MDLNYNGNIMDRESGLSDVMPCQLVNIYILKECIVLKMSASHNVLLDLNLYQHCWGNPKSYTIKYDHVFFIRISPVQK